MNKVASVSIHSLQLKYLRLTVVLDIAFRSTEVSLPFSKPADEARAARSPARSTLEQMAQDKVKWDVSSSSLAHHV